jgi:hypothetical protein
VAWIQVLEGRNPGATYDIGHRTCTVGRGTGNYVQLLDADVSRRHFQLAWDDGRHRAVDLSSANGVFVNGERVLDTFLNDGDRLSLGKTVLLYRAAEALPGAADFAQQYKNASREVAGVATQAVDMGEVLSMLSGMRGAPGAWEDAPRAAPPSATLPRPAAGPGALLDHLSHLADAGEDPDRLLAVAAAGTARALHACRASVMLRRLDPAGQRHRLVPASLWVRPGLPPSAREVLVHEGVVRDVAGGRTTQAALGNAGTGPTAALAAAVADGGLWYGLLYADSLESPPPAWRKQHLDFMASVAARLGALLRAST